jgi:hypothetical protein
MKPIPKLSILLFQRDTTWVAVSLEHFIVGQGKTIKEAIRHWMSDTAGQFILDADAGEEMLSDTPPAPNEYWERYKASDIKIRLEV